MIAKERKELLVGLAKAVTQSIQTMGAKTPEELEFVINTMAKAEACGFTIGEIHEKCMKILQDTLFGDKKGLSERVALLEKRFGKPLKRLKED